MDWSKIDWAVVGATFVGPIVAVGITLWYQERSERRKARRELYSVMMRWRRHVTSADFVGSLNLVPVHFADSPNVLTKYAELISTYEDAAWSNPDHRQRLYDLVHTRVAYVLSAMSETVGVKIDQLHILRGAYAPQGWADEEAQNRALRDLAGQVLIGSKALNVIVHPPVPHPVNTGEPENNPASDPLLSKHDLAKPNANGPWCSGAS